MLMTRLQSVGFLLGGTVLLILAALDFFFSPDPAGVQIDGPEPSLANIAVGRSIPVAFTLHNPTSKRVRIVGLLEC